MKASNIEICMLTPKLTITLITCWFQCQLQICLVLVPMNILSRMLGEVPNVLESMLIQPIIVVLPMLLTPRTLLELVFLLVMDGCLIKFLMFINNDVDDKRKMI